MKIERTKNAARNVVFGIILKIYALALPFVMRTAMIYWLGPSDRHRPDRQRKRILSCTFVPAFLWPELDRNRYPQSAVFVLFQWAWLSFNHDAHFILRVFRFHDLYRPVSSDLYGLYPVPGAFPTVPEPDRLRTSGADSRRGRGRTCNTSTAGNGGYVYYRTLFYHDITIWKCHCAYSGDSVDL